MAAAMMAAALRRRAHVALVDRGRPFTYEDLLRRSTELTRTALAGMGRGERVAMLMPNGFNYVASKWATMRAGGVAVPLCPTHPLPELDYIIKDSRASTVFVDASLRPTLERWMADHAATHRSVVIPSATEATAPVALTDGQADAPLSDDDRALIIYTSGTTGRPKGVVWTHGMLRAQADALIPAWGWTPSDRILHVLPLHHVHGALLALGHCLWVGATCEFLNSAKGGFSAPDVWEAFARVDPPHISVFMAVPTIYVQLLEHYKQCSPADQRRYAAGARRLRLMVSGSAALPVPVFNEWEAITGHRLLERYGMTEFGMALSNPLSPASARTPGAVGAPLPSVEVRIVDASGAAVRGAGEGDLWVRGPSVFREYWGKPDATRATFADDGWFMTGDVAAVDESGRTFRILGRASVDVIKTGGYKVSALDVEAVLMEHPGIAEVAVVGVPDSVYGQVVGVVVALRPGVAMNIEDLRAWAKERIAAYKAPTRLHILPAIPRNAMGKVNKKELVKVFSLS